MARRSGIVVATALAAGVGMTLPALHSAHAARPAMAKKMTIVERNDKYGFARKKLTVMVGTKVTWLNKTDAPHTITGTGGWKFSSKSFGQGQKVSFTFKKVGMYSYKCAIHPYMKATIIVKK